MPHTRGGGAITDDGWVYEGAVTVSTGAFKLTFVLGLVLTITRTKPTTAKSTVMSVIRTSVAKVASWFDLGIGGQTPAFA